MKAHATAIALAAIIAASAVTGWSADEAKTVKVFILAGQSNMEGKAPNSLFEYQATAPQTKDLFAHLRQDGQWIVRDDVFIKFLDRKGGLTIGYGSPDRTGAELEFGWMMGDRFDEPVLLIKAAWGGHSLCKLFRSPSAGLPSNEILQAELEQGRIASSRTTRRTRRTTPCRRWRTSSSRMARRTATSWPR